MYHLKLRNQFYNVKGIAFSEKPTENHHANLQLPPSALCTDLSFSSLFISLTHNVTVLPRQPLQQATEKKV